MVWIDISHGADQLVKDVVIESKHDFLHVDYLQLFHPHFDKFIKLLVSLFALDWTPLVQRVVKNSQFEIHSSLIWYFVTVFEGINKVLAQTFVFLISSLEAH